MPKQADVMTERLEQVDWRAVETALDERGHARIGGLLQPHECVALGSLYEDDGRFRSRIVMERYRFGVGEYKYFANPLPPVVETLRREIYPRLAPIANRWMALLGERARFPLDLAGLLVRCRQHGQNRPMRDLRFSSPISRSGE